MNDINNEKNTLSYDYTIAAENFTRARNKAFISKLSNIMNSKQDDLLSFNDVKEILKPKNQIYMGMKTIPLNLIVGSEGRYRDFNKNFHPRKEFMRARWENINRAQIKDIPLPAISLYEIGGAYFVRDGNHRVSVARLEGGEAIDAEVTSLSSEISIAPSMTTDDLRKAVIDLEKKIFYEKTLFLELTGDNGLNFTATGSYDRIYMHILDHKYYLNLDEQKEIPFSDALVSWYKKIYKPIIKIINKEKLDSVFPGKSTSDLYILIVRHWDFQKRNKGYNYSVTASAKNFAHRYGNQQKQTIRIIRILLDKLFRKEAFVL